MTVHHLCSLDDLIEAYKQHQRRARGLRDVTVHGYERSRAPFLPSNPRRRPHRHHKAQSRRRSAVCRLDEGPVLCLFDEDRGHGVAVVLFVPADGGTMRPAA